MTLKSLKYFSKIAELQHFTKAANDLYISQPSLSYAISELEKELGVILFDRDDKKVKLTHYGEIFLPYVNKALAILSEGEKILKEEASVKHSETISIGHIQSLSSTLIPSLIENFYQDPLNQNILFSFSQKDNDNLVKAFLNKKFDIIFTVEEVKNAITYPVARQDLSLVVASNHPFTSKKKVSLKELENENFILINPETNLRKIIDKEFKNLNFKPKIYLEMSSCINILTYVEKNFGISIIPKVDILDSKKSVVPIEIENLVLNRIIYANWFPPQKENISLKKVKNFINTFFYIEN
ncbi:MAG: LysR family transcriptional regulator [Fusobacterium gastrosuis]|uniref:LysR family transcriptional regulator n=1 Tax=Fusobacterium gastrosuis TaxID=1755100 RepID=UPI002A8A4F54|nr:LysR family transcriptional regulator [Fusobacterium gastrosuis]